MCLRFSQRHEGNAADGCTVNALAMKIGSALEPRLVDVVILDSPLHDVIYLLHWRQIDLRVEIQSLNLA